MKHGGLLKTSVKFNKSIVRFSSWGYILILLRQVGAGWSGVM